MNDESSDESARPDVEDRPDVDEVLDRVGFDPADSVLTRRQAEVLALREHGLSQATIAEMLGTSRANVSGVEGSARENVRKATETVEFAAALDAPVQVPISAGTDLYDLPQQVYAACDDAGVKVEHTAPDLMKHVSDEAGDAVKGRQVQRELLVGVAADGSVSVRQPRDR